MYNALFDFSQKVVLAMSRILKHSAEHFYSELGQHTSAGEHVLQLKWNIEIWDIERMVGKIGRRRGRIFIEEV